MQGGDGLNGQALGQQQQTANIDTAVAQAGLNNVNQVTPDGNLTYNITGGQTVNGNFVPQYTATTTLSPEQQKIYDQTTGLQSQALGIAPGVLNNVNTAVNTPLTDNATLRNQAYDALTARSTQALDLQQQQQATQLANQGINPGSEAWDNAMRPIEQARVDASNQATINTGNVAQQNLGMEQTIRNQPLQDYSTLMGFGGSVQNPNFVNTPQTQIQSTDMISPQIAAYQANTAANNATMGGLFGLGGSVLGAGTLLGGKYLLGGI